MVDQYQHGYDPAFATVPQKADHPDEVSLCRAMQVWAIREVDPRNNQRDCCINDWFAEEFLIGKNL
jgi:hypothetical protein